MKTIHLNSENDPCRTHRAAKLLALLLALSSAVHAQTPLFPIASNGVVMSWAFDGSNFLVGVEGPLSPPTSIAAQMLSTNGSQVGPLISVGRTGVATALAFDGTNYLLIWEDDELGALTNASYQIYGQFISRAGATVGAPFNISGLGVQFDGIRTMAFGGGKYLVTYTRLINPDQGSSSTNRYIAGKMVSPDGSLGSEFRISTGYGKASDVAFDGNNFFVVWCEDFADAEIRGRFVSPAGVPGAEISINASLAPSDNPVTVVFGGTNYLVVWNDEVGGAGTYTWDAFAQLVSPAGALVGGVITVVAEPGPQLAASAAFDGRRFLVAWADLQNPTNWDGYGRFINASGSVFGDKFALSTDPQNQICGVGFAAGRYLVVVNSGVVMGDGGFTAADSVGGMFLTPPDDPRILTADPGFGVRTNRFGFTIAGYTNAVVVVDACTNLNQPVWRPLQTNTLAGGSAYFSDPDWASYRGRFYRLRLP